MSLKLPGGTRVSSQALENNANVMQCCHFIIFFNIVRVEGKVLWAGIQLAYATRHVIYFATAATEKHDRTDTLIVLGSSEHMTTLNCCCQTWISWEAVAGDFVQVMDVFLGVEIYLLGLFWCLCLLGHLFISVMETEKHRSSRAAWGKPICIFKRRSKE